MLRVYIGLTPICFVDKNYPLPHAQGVFYSTDDRPETLLQIIDMVERCKEVKQVLICQRDSEKAFREFKSLFRVIEAAGGLVLNPDNEVLFIHRLGKWDLPKGKIEEGESTKVAAVREVSEECGVSGLQIMKKLKSTYHTYNQKSERILKKTYWYEMRLESRSKLIPQAEEGISEAKWMNKENIKSAMKNTFPSVKDVVSEYFN